MDNFNIQMFGDNDTLTSARELKINTGYADGDTRIITLPNPKNQNQLTSDTFIQLTTFMTENNPIIGDKAGASSTGVIEAYIQETTRRKLDLT